MASTRLVVHATAEPRPDDQSICSFVQSGLPAGAIENGTAGSRGWEIPKSTLRCGGRDGADMRIAERGQIEDASDSDVNARLAVKKWLNLEPGFNLGPTTKIALIREMQSGFNSHNDELAILAILDNSDEIDLEAIFGPQGIDPYELDTDFQGAEEGPWALWLSCAQEDLAGREAALREITPPFAGEWRDQPPATHRGPAPFPGWEGDPT